MIVALQQKTPLSLETSLQSDSCCTAAYQAGWGCYGADKRFVTRIKEPEMKNISEQFIATNKANVEALTALTSQAFAGVEKLVELNLATSKAALSDSASQMKAALEVKGAPELVSLPSDLLKPVADRATAYAEQVKSIITDSSAELTKMVEAKVAEAQKAIDGVVELLTKNAPAGTETAVAAFKNALTAGQSAMESVQTQTKQAVETAQANFSAATTQTTDAVKKASKKA
jgi:phasin family protein